MNIPKIPKGWKELNEEIIQTKICVYCGACGSFCENISFDADQEVPLENGACKDQNTCRDGFGTCYNLCPKTGSEYITTKLLDQWSFQGEQGGKPFGHVLEIVSAKFKGSASGARFQAGGAITSLLVAALQDKLADCAITTAADQRNRPKPMLATTPEEVLECAGTKWNQGPALSLIGKAIVEEYHDIAVVGTPCQIQALRKMQNHPRFDFETYDLVKYAIGTFCLGASQNQRLGPFLVSRGVQPAKVRGTAEKDFKIVFSTADGKIEVPHNALFTQCVRENCRSCSDYTAAFADIAAGMVGSPDGWSTLIVRTPRGKELLDHARALGILETKVLPAETEDSIRSLDRSRTDWVRIEKIVKLAPDIRSFHIRDERIARTYRPGQFVVLWLQDIDFFPMGISRVTDDLLEITVQKIGPGTTALFAMKEGDELGIRGPYGNGWHTADGRNILVVGGGIGIAAVTTVIDDLKATGKNVWVAIGARNKTSLIFEKRLRALAPDCCCTTDDGSAGQKCFVTDPLADLIAEHKIDLILTCGPEAMMKLVFDLAENRKIMVQASLERFMKCAVGICGSCCAGEKDNVTICKDGPVFNSTQLRQIPQFGTYKK